MILKAVIVKSKKRKIQEIIRTGYFYATKTEGNNASRTIGFYKNEEIAINNYPKNIEGIINILIDTDNMNFFEKDNVPVQLKPKFSETDFEYVFTFEENLTDLHCKINICNYSF